MCCQVNYLVNCDVLLCFVMVINIYVTILVSLAVFRSKAFASDPGTSYKLGE